MNSYNRITNANIHCGRIENPTELSGKETENSGKKTDDSGKKSDDGGSVTAPVSSTVSGQKDTDHTSTTQAPHKHHTSTTQVSKLIETMGDNTYSLKEIMELMGLKNRRHFFYEYIIPAVKEELITLLFPDQPKHPKQKYYLTEKGKQMINNK